MDLQLAGKVALITGSSRGIGLATAKALAAEGCRLMLSARSAEPLAAAAAALRTSGVDVAAHPADVSKPEEAAGLVQAAVTAFGGIDVLINNVGGGGGARIADSTDDDWRSALERNLIQTVRMMRRYGRNAGYPTSPVQTRTCSFPASGSSVALASAQGQTLFARARREVGSSHSGPTCPG